MGPLISVIVPVYKAELYLKKCVESIRNQTYQNLEIILVNDGSPDQSGAMCDEFAKVDSRIKVIHKENGGQASARNYGLDSMTGELVGFVDSDDWIEPDMYEILYKRMLTENAEISCCGIARYAEDKIVSYFNKNLSEQFVLTTEQAQKELIANYRITYSLCDKLFTKSIFENLRFWDGKIFEDMQLIPHCVDRAERIVYTAQPLYCYRQSADSTMRGNFSIKHYSNILASLDRIELLKEKYPELVDMAMADHLAQCLVIIERSFGVPEWNDRRKELIRYAKKPVKKDILKFCSRKVKFRRVLLKIHPTIYALFGKVNNLRAKISNGIR